MAWLKSLHIVFFLIWSAGLIYMPALFAAYASASGKKERRRMRIVSRFTFIAVASPAAILAIGTGTWLVYATAIQGTWLPAKLLAVTFMGMFHVYCGRRVVEMEKDHLVFRRNFQIALVIVPFVLVSTVLWLVLAKPALWPTGGW